MRLDSAYLPSADRGGDAPCGRPLPRLKLPCRIGL